MALGPAIEVLAAFLPDSMIVDVFDQSPSAPAGWSRLFSPVALLGGSNGGDPSLSARLATATTTSSQSTTDNSPFAGGGGGMSFLATILAVVATLIGVVALLRLTVGEEFFSTRWLH